METSELLSLFFLCYCVASWCCSFWKKNVEMLKLKPHQFQLHFCLFIPQLINRLEINLIWVELRFVWMQKKKSLPYIAVLFFFDNPKSIFCSVNCRKPHKTPKWNVKPCCTFRLKLSISIWCEFRLAHQNIDEHLPSSTWNRNLLQLSYFVRTSFVFNGITFDFYMWV